MTPSGRQNSNHVGRHVTHALRGFDVLRLDLVREALEFKQAGDLTGSPKPLSEWYEDLLTLEERFRDGEGDPKRHRVGR